MADRIGIINRGELILVEDKAQLMRKLGRKELRLHLAERLESIPAPLEQFKLTLSADGTTLVYSFETEGERTRITALLRELNQLHLNFRDLETQQSSLEDIFVSLVRSAP